MNGWKHTDHSMEWTDEQWRNLSLYGFCREHGLPNECRLSSLPDGSRLWAMLCPRDDGYDESEAR
jgi:hypothetical protein